ncbi:MAG: type II toxin-antitoxin system mRNA interferase toxin, RelE/StbE family [Bacilli bacterium]|nr:type II toxin-antitoxin system mRNA interferase toxin, RelE/StbE family [Bacilli bacterium]
MTAALTIFLKAVVRCNGIPFTLEIPNEETNKAFNEADDIVDQLSEGKELDPKYKDHKLVGEYEGKRECHIEPDFLLIYQIVKSEIVLLLVRVGSHSELFR